MLEWSACGDMNVCSASKAGNSSSHQDGEEITLTESDIPGADLAEPFEKHNIQDLRWWLLCRGVKVPMSIKKAALIARVKTVKEQSTPLVDVDGSFLYKKYEKMTKAGKNVCGLPVPSQPVSRWTAMDSTNYQSIALSLPCVTQGMVYTYLAGHVSPVGEHGAFRALTRGYTQWASGRLEEILVNTKNPLWSHVKCKTKPSMKVGMYNTYILLGQEGDLPYT